ncbi:MAG: hypothetical protein ACK5KP_02925 [Paludibacteraceae bacterium]
MLSCVKEIGISAEYHIINNTNHALQLLKYGYKQDTIQIAEKGNYTIVQNGGSSSIPPPFEHYQGDSIVIQFDDAKTLIYKASESSAEKNIYHQNTYELSDVVVKERVFYHYVYDFFITTEDYESAK